jgi:hypothetical protein
MKRPSRRLAAGAAALIAAATLAAPGVAGATDTHPGTAATTTHSEDDLGPRLERACLRIPNLEIRTTNLLERLNGDATVKGSLAWLQERIDEAAGNDRDQLVTVLENRLEVRTASIDVLETRQDALADARQLCSDHGVEL